MDTYTIMIAYPKPRGGWKWVEHANKLTSNQVIEQIVILIEEHEDIRIYKE